MRRLSSIVLLSGLGAAACDDHAAPTARGTSSNSIHPGGVSSGRATASATSASAAPDATAAPSAWAAPGGTAIFVPLPGATTSAAIDARWPPEGFLVKKAKLAGFEVIASDEVSVALKRHYVDNVTGTNTAAFPACPSLATVRERKGVSIMSRGGGDPVPGGGGSTPSWLVYRDGERFGVIVVHATTPRGDYGTDVACCLSGTDVDAASARATLTDGKAKKALEVCLVAMNGGGAR